MSLLSDLNVALEPVGIPLETGVFSDSAPDQYIVLVPLGDSFDLHADNTPGVDVQEARVSIYTKGSYTAAKNAFVRMVLAAGLTVTARQYIGYEPDTGYHHYNVDVAHFYELEG